MKPGDMIILHSMCVYPIPKGVIAILKNLNYDMKFWKRRYGSCYIFPPLFNVEVITIHGKIENFDVWDYSAIEVIK